MRDVYSSGLPILARTLCSHRYVLHVASHCESQCLVFLILCTLRLLTGLGGNSLSLHWNAPILFFYQMPLSIDDCCVGLQNGNVLVPILLSHQLT